MNTPGARLSEAEAHQELMLMDSRVAGMPVDHFFDRLRRLDLPYAGVLARFRELLTEIRLCGGKVIHLGKIIANEILEFMESDPDLPAGVQLGAALRGLGQLAPVLGLPLAPLSAEVEAQGFANLCAGTGYREQMERRALVFFRRLAIVLNLTKNLLSAGQASTRLDEVTFEEPTLFELEPSENPFDLDDLSAIPPTTLAVVKLLVKISLADGHFGDEEKTLIAQTLAHMGESVSESQFERLVAESTKESIETILEVVTHQPVMYKEKLLLLAMLVTAADGRVETIEKKLLAQAAPLLGISRQRFSEIAKDAVSLMKTRKTSLAESAKPIVHSFMHIAGSASAPDPATGVSTTEPCEADMPDVRARSDDVRPAPREEPRPQADSALRPEHATAHKAPIESASSEPKAPPLPSPTPPSKNQKIWRCPACHMPQFQDFDECPQCGVIVAKFKEKRGVQWKDLEPDLMVEVPIDPGDEPHGAPAQATFAAKGIPVPSVCASCSVPLPAGAKFCPACGMRAG
jgi:tellurite resistance protein